MAKRNILSFEERLLHMARSLVEYGRYGGAEEKAVKILHRHHPETGPDVCRTAFSAYARAYRDAIPFVAANSGYYRKLHEEKKDIRDADGRHVLSEAEMEFTKEHPGVPERAIVSMVWWIYDWHHVR